MNQAPFALRVRNPDVLTCIANLSNDEVFTPPELASSVLDEIEVAWANSHNGASIWENTSVRFLDPFTKSGIFLREIAARLSVGLATQIPDLNSRVDHILSNQLFGIGVTHLTSLLARRSLYCSKFANGPHSIATVFTTQDGNIWFERTEHQWAGGNAHFVGVDKDGHEVVRSKNGRCRYCGANQGDYDRANELETYAYALIHEDRPHDLIKRAFGDEMYFDVVVGNPPYQLGSDGGTRDVPIYQKFVQQAKLLDPQLLVMVTPSRWMAGGLGLNEFRTEMLADKRISKIVDYPISKEVFPGVEVKGGVSFFVWDSAFQGDCTFSTFRDNNVVSSSVRALDEFDILVRDSNALPILRKVLSHSGESITSILAVDKEFGWTSNFDGFHSQPREGDIPLHYIRKGIRHIGFIARSEVQKSKELIDVWKVMVPAAGSDGGQKIPDVVLGKPHIAPSPSVCTQSLLFFSAENEAEARSIESYYRTKFFRFLVSLRKITQHATRSTYTWVPKLTWDRVWTDDELYAKYGLTQSESAYISKVIRDMESKGE
jgi:site-specific DNA-methyltransferase (adenine-specific)